eukprot:3432677-Pyramimonas_sp.AAC.1
MHDVPVKSGTLTERSDSADGSGFIVPIMCVHDLVIFFKVHILGVYMPGGRFRHFSFRTKGDICGVQKANRVAKVPLAGEL